MPKAGTQSPNVSGVLNEASEQEGISSEKQNSFETIFNAIKTLFTMIIS